MSNKKIPTIFMGTPEFSVPSLESIINSDYLDLQLIITQPDKKVGRDQVLTPPPVKVIGEKHGIKILQPEKIRNSEVIDQIKQYNPELIIVAAYGKILPLEILNLPKYGCINIHASLLPKYRGASPIQFSILEGETETGITIMKMAEGMDTGDIISQAKIDIENTDTSQTLHDKLAKLGAELLSKTLPNYLAGKITSQTQDGNKATYTKILTKQDGEIDFSKTAKQIDQKLRAFTPWPGVYTFFNNKKLQILKLQIDEQINPLIPTGKIYEAENKLMINCSEGAIVLESIQIEGKKAMSGKDFINGYLK